MELLGNTTVDSQTEPAAPLRLSSTSFSIFTGWILSVYVRFDPSLTPSPFVYFCVDLSVLPSISPPPFICRLPPFFNSTRSHTNTHTHTHTRTRTLKQAKTHNELHTHTPTPGGNPGLVPLPGYLVLAYILQYSVRSCGCVCVCVYVRAWSVCWWAVTRKCITPISLSSRSSSEIGIHFTLPAWAGVVIEEPSNSSAA